MFAQRMMKEGGTTPPERIAYAFRLATARRPKPAESRDPAGRVPAELRIGSQSKPDAALKYVSYGEYPRDAGARRQRAGRLHQRDEPDPQPERNGDEGVAMDPRFDVPLNRDPAAFSWTAGLGIGAAALAELLQFDLLAQSAAASPLDATGGLAGTAAFCAEGQAGHLPVPGRRARRRSTCSTTSRSSPERHGTDLPDSIRNGQRLTAMTAGQTSFPVAPVDLHVRAARAIGRLGQRAAAAHREGRRRPVLHQVDAHRADQSRSGGDVCADRVSARRAGRAWARG